jgi:E1A-binding protein p400
MTPKLVLNRPGAPNVISVSGLGQSLTQAQLQGTQLKLAMDNNQQFSGIVAKGIQVAGKTTGPQIQFYRQQAIRPQVKVLHTTGTGDQAGSSGTIVQTASGQSFKLPEGGTGTLIQANSVGQTIQVQSGQKVTVATINPGQNPGQNQTVDGQTGGTSGNVTVQVSTGQGIRPQYKQLTAGKQTAGRQLLDTDLVVMKRQILGQQGKTQIMSTSPQTQIFTPTNIQVGQNAATGAQQMTLVKTTGASASGSGSGTGNTTLGTVGMTLSQVKQGTLKTTPITNQNDHSRFLAVQQVQFAPQRKGATGKLTQIAQVSGKGGTQLIVNPKTGIPGTVTVQQLPVLRHAQTLAGGQILLGKGGLGRIIPVSVSTQPNRQTFQVRFFSKLKIFLSKAFKVFPLKLPKISFNQWIIFSE